MGIAKGRKLFNSIHKAIGKGLILISLTLVCPNVAHAFKCDTLRSDQYILNAKIIFLGTVTNISPLKLTAQEPFDSKTSQVTFEVKKIWKGVIDNSPTIKVNHLEKGYWPNPFVEKKTYVVFLNDDSNLEFPVCGKAIPIIGDNQILLELITNPSTAK